MLRNLDIFSSFPQLYTPLFMGFFLYSYDSHMVSKRCLLIYDFFYFWFILLLTSKRCIQYLDVSLGDCYKSRQNTDKTQTKHV